MSLQVAGVCKEFLLLGKRELLNVFRNKRVLRGRIGVSIVLNLLVALVFFRTADWGDVDGNNVPEII